MMKFELKKNNRWVFNAMTVLLMLLIFVAHVFRVQIPEVVFLGLTLVMICSSQRDQILATLIMCIPLSMIFGITYTFVAGFALWILWYRDKIRINFTVIPILLLIIWELPHCFGETISIKWLIAEFIPFLFCGLLMWQDSSEVDYGFVVRCLSFCTVVLCLTLLGMVLVRSNMNVAAAFMNMQRLGITEEEYTTATLQINPNTLGIMCVLAITGLLQLVTTGQGRPTDMLMAVVMLFCGALTTSKTFLLLLLTMVLLFWLAQAGSVWKKLRFLLLAAVVGVIVLVVLSLVFPVVIENFVTRFTVGDITSGRTTLLRIYNKFLYSRPDVLMFGVGLTNFGHKIVTEYAVASVVPHNGIQEALIAWGIPGFALFVVFLGTLVWSGKKTARNQSLLNYIPLVILLAKIQAGQMLTSGYTMLAFAYCYLSLSHNFERDMENRTKKRTLLKKRLDK